MQSKPHSSNDGRFYTLDVLRGIAAVAVIVFHWVHFLSPDMLGLGPHPRPFFVPLQVVYLYGGAAVDFFFCLSGFVFFAVYFKPLNQGRSSLREFAVHRLARLYPLHWVALFLTAALQASFLHLHGRYFECQNNGALDLLLQFFLVHFWGRSQEVSFNLPTWSLSIEMLVYCAFFIYARHLPRFWILATLVVSAVSFAVIKQWSPSIGRGMSSFFEGGLMWLFYDLITRRRPQLRAVAGLVALAGAALAWSMILLFVYQPSALPEWLARLPLKLRTGFRFYAMFPLTILAFALLEPWTRAASRRLVFLGDTSYSIYLIHFPLQIATVLLLDGMHLDRTIFLSEWFFIAFIVGALALGWLSFRYLERPAQSFIRQRMLPRDYAEPRPVGN